LPGTGGGSLLVAVSLLGPGADQLFSRITLELGGALYAVIPCRRYREQFQDQAAQAEFDRLYRQASYFETLEQYLDSTSEAHMAAGRVVVERSTVLVAVWDGKPGGHGGTADVVAYAREREVPVEVIWPEGATRD
jgi:hypothetical protein